MAKTLVQRLARERQNATGERYSTCLRYVQEHLAELAPEYLRRRAEARTAGSAQAPSGSVPAPEPLRAEAGSVDPAAHRGAAEATAGLAVVFSSAGRTPKQ